MRVNGLVLKGESMYEDEEVSDSNRFNAVDGGSVFFLPRMQLLRIATTHPTLQGRRPNRPNQLELVRLGLLSFYSP